MPVFVAIPVGETRHPSPGQLDRRDSFLGQLSQYFEVRNNYLETGLPSLTRGRRCEDDAQRFRLYLEAIALRQCPLDIPEPHDQGFRTIVTADSDLSRPAIPGDRFSGAVGIGGHDSGITGHGTGERQYDGVMVSRIGPT